MQTPSDPSMSTTRALAPDLARGLMLLLIALANVPWFLYGEPTALTSAHRIDASGADTVWQAIAIVAIDARSYPLFAFLFGYGMWQLYTRQQQLGRDEPAARRLVLLRNAWLLVFGAVHATLLWYGDILGAYGLAGLIVAWLFIRRTDRALIVWVIALASLLALAAVFAFVGGLLIPAEYRDVAEGGYEIPDLSGITPYLASILPRLSFWVMGVFGQAIFSLAVPIAVLLAIVCARRRILEDPAQHRRLLLRTAAIGIPIGWLGGVPALLVHLGAWDVPSWTASMLHTFTGIFGALGYVSLFALLAAWLAARGRTGGITRGLTAVGKRSLTCYLLQSLIFAPLLSAWGLGLGGVLSEWQAVLVAIGVWLVTVLVAVLLDRAGRRGPAEWLLRLLVYRGQRANATPVSAAAS
ncbi:hypothetical protein GCM10011490_09460 [Pseudoclavibacter endophyticus]|uniref:DUF418 domain-containing protein n=1 Tax=Pseudoclavibacter endophyticus TaxID=1778590 RepID=A0A6H9WF75_9MICO|nr:DUF418 domain-containing protein [Pseudoclavibacter endophyticus]KAB1649599.1 DUF418 domain-containing protein [Pseudoclavibacter endophyticus]GGA61328.1 hypothetical protein GCM10011490_09460 [Pseudoclavibacter endophyticus]